MDVQGEEVGESLWVVGGKGGPWAEPEDAQSLVSRKTIQVYDCSSGIVMNSSVFHSPRCHYLEHLSIWSSLHKGQHRELRIYPQGSGNPLEDFKQCTFLKSYLGFCTIKHSFFFPLPLLISLLVPRVPGIDARPGKTAQSAEGSPAFDAIGRKDLCGIMDMETELV